MITKTQVGIFFLVNNDLLFDNTPVNQGEVYADATGFRRQYHCKETLISHSSVEQLFKNHAYDYYPRGRVVYFNKINTFKLYADHCIKKSNIEKVVSLFQLPAYRLARDEHYQCAICNATYQE